METNMANTVDGTSNFSLFLTNVTCLPFLTWNNSQLNNSSPAQCGLNNTQNFTNLDPAFLSFLHELLQPSNLLPEPLPNDVIITFIVLYSFIIILAVVGNTIVVIVIGRHRLRRSVTDMYIFSLAISDILIATLNMPFQLSFVIANEWLAEGTAGEFLCKFTNYVQGVTIVACVLTLTAIAIDRYIVICQPKLSRKIHSKKSAIIGIVVVWLIALCALSPHLVFQKLDQRLKVTENAIGVGWVCAEFYPRGKADGKLYSVFVYIFLYVIPVLIMIFTYGAITHRLWLKRSVFPVSQNSSQFARGVAHKKKITKLLIVLVLAFTVLWLPFFSFSMFTKFADADVHAFRIKMAVLQLVGYSNCCVNPIMYTFLNNSFQKEFIRMCRCIPCFTRDAVSSSVKTDTESKI
ncbi:cholecystokinin receptor-like [Mercenaria mercenaria]|uniref:cholecystokinin receptor-like n=1 Tax=Mercenaria mercenaria TaxID=6596 RepID=UPI001E1D8D0C|nr:cholecystokinin receptor-like [Mercenaria mercenaria]